MTTATTLPRLVSLDQFRGYTVAGMFVVNFLGGFAVTPAILKHHHSYCSYADTIMPQFLFAVGFAMRLTFVRRAQTQGLAAAYGRMAWRLGGLILLSLVIYTAGAPAQTWSQLSDLGFWEALKVPFKRTWFQTLMHIAVTSLFILPVIRAGALLRVIYMIVAPVTHVSLSAWFNFTWVNTAPMGIDGGPLGFLTWTIPAVVGTLACDAVTNPLHPYRVRTMLTWSLLLMLAGYILSCGSRSYDVPIATQRAFARHKLEIAKLAQSPVWIPTHHLDNRDAYLFLTEPPFVPPPDHTKRQWNYWMMSQRSGSVSYLTFAAGFSLAVFVLFYVACDRYGWNVPLFRTFGTNALAAYILHGMVDHAVSPFIPRDAPAWYVAAGFAVFFGLTYLFVRSLEKKGIMVRL